MKQTHLLQNSYRFLIDLVYPNRCPCCNQVIAWDAWICEACQIETALNPDTVCSGCGKPFDDCMCSESLAFDGAMAVSRYEGRARQGILQLKQAEMRFLLSQRFRFVRICFGKSRAEFRSIR